MAKKSKLLAALDAHKGRDFKKEHQKKLQKQAERRKKTKSVEKGSDDESGSGGESESEQASGAQVDATPAQLDTESEGWETDESEAALTAVGSVVFQIIMLGFDGSCFRLTPHALTIARVTVTVTATVKRVRMGPNLARRGVK